MRFGFFFLLLNSCTSVPKVAQVATPSADQSCTNYYLQINLDAASLFSPALTGNAKLALQDFLKQKILPNKKIYGQSVREYKMDGKTADQIDAEMKQLKCKKQVTEIQDPKTHEPILVQGKSSPLWSYLCPDGGFVRIKPKGDPSSKFLPQPHGSKGMRYPYNSEFKTFDDEAFKINEDGKPSPKWPKDMIRDVNLSCWSRDVHKNLTVH